MIYFILLLIMTFFTGVIVPFEVFVIYAWLVWLIKWITSWFYKPYTANHKPTVSAIVPVLGEDPVMFEKCLASIKAANPDEIHVVFDSREKSSHLMDIANAHTDNVHYSTTEGKRTSVATGIANSKSDIVIIMDSDTFFENEHSIEELMKPFADLSVGGVTTKQKIHNPKGNMVRRFAAWMEDVRFAIGSIPAQGTFESIGCLPGRAIALRKEAISPHIDEFLNETFLGKKSITGDDRVLTALLMANGWKTVYQSTSVVYTDCPNTWKAFIQQQIRWARSSQRETIKALGWLWKKPFTMFVFVTDMLTPILFVVTILLDIIIALTGNSAFSVPILWAIPMALIGMSITFGLKQHPHLLQEPKDLLMLPVYALFMTFVMVPIRIYGLITLNNGQWMTRK